MPSPQLHPLRLGELLDVAFGVYRARFAPLLVVTIVSSAVPVALSVYIEAAGGAVANLQLASVNLLLNAVLGSIGTAASTLVVAENYMGRSITAREAFQRAVPFIGRVIVAAVLSTLVIGLGLVLFVVPGLIALSGLAVTTPALVVEDIESGNAAMARSWGLSRGHRRRLLAAMFTVGMIMYLPFFAVGVLAASGDATPSASTLAFTLVAYLLVALIQPLFYCLLTVAYYDLRVRKEAFDLELLAGGLSRA